MHPNEIETDAELVRDLLRAQHPQWADREIERVPSAGTDNAMYRLGEDLAVRLPKIDWAIDAIVKERHWLGTLARSLPLAVPLPVAHGEPCDAYPHPWNVVEWLPGRTAPADEVDRGEIAIELAGFINHLRAIDPIGGPRHRRGEPLAHQDAAVRASAAALDGEVDRRALLESWEEAMSAPEHPGEPIWFHGDLAYLNVLTRDEQVVAIIDWGLCGVGDPAIDLLPAWSFLTAENRALFRDQLQVDAASWARGRGWALAGVTSIPYYRETNPVLVADKVRAIEAVLAASD